jgi:type II secretory pathway pseudopilin PulG
MSLFELVIVIAVGAILVLLLLVSTRTVLVQTKVNRVREEHRQLALALSRYSLDYGTAPGADLGLDALVRGSRGRAALPEDPFQAGGRTYAYLPVPKSAGGGYLLISPGPDGEFDIPDALLPFCWGVPGAEALRGPDHPPPSPTTAFTGAMQLYLGQHQFEAAREGEAGDVITYVRN